MIPSSMIGVASKPRPMRHPLGLEGPLRHEAANVLRRDLFERTVALPAVVPGERQPARRILEPIEDVL